MTLKLWCLFVRVLPRHLGMSFGDPQGLIPPVHSWQSVWVPPMCACGWYGIIIRDISVENGSGLSNIQCEDIDVHGVVVGILIQVDCMYGRV